jgi:predicted alpha/beta hydrolase family esterase
MAQDILLVGGFYASGKSHLCSRFTDSHVVDLGSLKRQIDPHYDPRDQRSSDQLRRDIWSTHLPKSLGDAVKADHTSIVVAGSFGTRARRDMIANTAVSLVGEQNVRGIFLMPPMKTAIERIKLTRVGDSFMVNDSSYPQYFRAACESFRRSDNSDLILPSDPLQIPREYRAMLTASKTHTEITKEPSFQWVTAKHLDRETIARLRDTQDKYEMQRIIEDEEAMKNGAERVCGFRSAERI